MPARFQGSQRNKKGAPFSLERAPARQDLLPGSPRDRETALVRLPQPRARSQARGGGGRLLRCALPRTRQAQTVKCAAKTLALGAAPQARGKVARGRDLARPGQLPGPGPWRPDEPQPGSGQLYKSPGAGRAHGRSQPARPGSSWH